MLAPRVVILGSGFAGLETAFLLRAKLDKVDADITVVSDRAEFLFKPNTIYLPFGAAEKPLHVPLRKAFDYHDIHHRIGHIEGVDPDRAVVHTSRGLPLHYDKLVIATGAGMAADEIPGLRQYGRQIWTPGQMHQLGEDLQWVVQDARHGHHRKVLFLVPPGNKCAGPLYEIAFMLDTWLRDKDVRHQVEITFTTYEQSFIQAFGPKLHEVVTEEFTTRSITGHTAVTPDKVTETEVAYSDGVTRPFDVLITFPPYVAGVRYDGLPSDDRGFLTCAPETRAVLDYPDIFAPGDAGDFPVKQAFLALLQADAVANTIVADLTGHTPHGLFEPTSMCVMEMFDKATFAQVPLRLTDDETSPVTVDFEAANEYRVGTSATWRLGKKALGLYLPTRFRHGKPFHAGAGWRVMETGLRAGSRLLAR